MSAAPRRERARAARSRKPGGCECYHVLLAREAPIARLVRGGPLALAEGSLIAVRMPGLGFCHAVAVFASIERVKELGAILDGDAVEPVDPRLGADAVVPRVGVDAALGAGLVVVERERPAALVDAPLADLAAKIGAALALDEAGQGAVGLRVGRWPWPMFTIDDRSQVPGRRESPSPVRGARAPRGVRREFGLALARGPRWANRR